ncbi:MAG: nucleotidyltransferase family protein [Mariprofundaceae bacterium]|nr:nucleotidyltransferase family protein [Mariprofundaceae bacterium]
MKDIAWGDAAFWQHAWGEGVGAFIWHIAQYHGQDIEEGLRSELIERPLREQTAHSLMLRSVAVELLGAFDAAGLPVLMLRGQALADVFYNPPGLRPQTDIDLLVEGVNADRLAELLGGAGFSPLPGYPLLFTRDGVMLDVHTEPLGIERIGAWALLTPLRAPDFFAAAHSGMLAGQASLLVGAQVQLPYLCFHAMKHSFERLIWLLDIACMARRVTEKNGWGETLEAVERFCLQRPCYYALSYADAYLAAGVPAEVLEGLKPDMGWFERQLFARFMRHEAVPFLAERVFARMQPDSLHRVAFWKETVWPQAEVRAQVNADPQARGGFVAKRIRQLGLAAAILVSEMWALLRR